MRARPPPVAETGSVTKRRGRQMRRAPSVRIAGHRKRGGNASIPSAPANHAKPLFMRFCVFFMSKKANGFRAINVRHSCMILLKILTFAYLQNPMKQITLSSPCSQELPHLPFSTQYTPISYCMLTKHLLMLSIIPKPHWESVGRIPST